MDEEWKENRDELDCLLQDGEVPHLSLKLMWFHLISLISSSFHRLDMTLAVAEALNPNKTKPTKTHVVSRWNYWLDGQAIEILF